MKSIVVVLFALLLSPLANASIGFNAGAGLPYLSQFGLNYVSASKMFSAEAGYGNFNISISDVGVDLTKMQLSLRYHPWMGSFYVGVGVGQETFTSKGSDTISGQTVNAEIKVTATTVAPQLGWMWGMADGGLWAGIDFEMVSPSGASSTTTTNADASVQATASYQQLINDTNDQAKKYGEASYTALTFLRVGYLF